MEKFEKKFKDYAFGGSVFYTFGTLFFSDDPVNELTYSKTLNSENNKNTDNNIIAKQKIN